MDLVRGQVAHTGFAPPRLRAFPPRFSTPRLLDFSTLRPLHPDIPAEDHRDPDRHRDVEVLLRAEAGQGAAHRDRERAEGDQQATDHAVAVLAAALEADRRVAKAAERDQRADAVDADGEDRETGRALDRIPTVFREAGVIDRRAPDRADRDCRDQQGDPRGYLADPVAGQQVELAEGEETDDEDGAGQVIGPGQGRVPAGRIADRLGGGGGPEHGEGHDPGDAVRGGSAEGVTDDQGHAAERDQGRENRQDNHGEPRNAATVTTALSLLESRSRAGEESRRTVQIRETTCSVASQCDPGVAMIGAMHGEGFRAAARWFTTGLTPISQLKQAGLSVFGDVMPGLWIARDN